MILYENKKFIKNNSGKDYGKIILLDEIINNRNILLFEAISKEQKEKGQREMVKKEIDIFYQLGKWLKERWSKPLKTKEEYNQKKEEFGRLNYLIAIGLEMSKENDKRIDSYIKNINGEKLKWLSLKKEDTENSPGGIKQNYGGLPYLELGTPRFPKDKIQGDFGFKTSTKELRKNIRKFIIMHEYGHLFEFMKDVITTGEGGIVDTLNDDPRKVIDSEGKANAYALDNMYRKDRRELLKNSELDKKQIRKSLEKVNNFKRGKNDDLTYFDLYRTGTALHSKSAKKTLESLEKEKKHFNY